MTRRVSTRHSALRTRTSADLIAIRLVTPLRAQKSDDESKRITEATDRPRRDHGGRRQGRAAHRSWRRRKASRCSRRCSKAASASAASTAAASSACATRRHGGWSTPAFLTINGGSIGAQIGVQAIDLVLVINNQRGLEQLVKNQFKLGADAGVAAGPVGRDASAAPTSRCARRSSATHARAGCLRA